MFGKMLFSNKVASELFKRGYRPEHLPPSDVLTLLCRAMYENGVPLNDAADMIDGLIGGDQKAMKRLRRSTGAIGLIYVNSTNPFTQAYLESDDD